MKQQHRNRFVRLELEPLESRTLMSGNVLASVSQGTLNIVGGGGDNTIQIAPSATSPGMVQVHALPFKESLTVTAVSDGVYTYEGNAIHLGHVTAFSFPDGSFTKIAADGDQIFGQLYPASATTGSMTFAGGTGEFAHASGSASYVISVGPKTGATNIDVVGTLSFGAKWCQPELKTTRHAEDDL